MKKINRSISIFALVIVLFFAGKVLSPDNHQVRSDSSASSSAQTTMGTVQNGISEVKSPLSGQKSIKNTSSSRLSSLDYKSGSSAVIIVNHDKSTLNPKDWKENKVIYSNLDSLNRTSRPNTAYLEQRNLANDSLRVRQYIRPTGWHQKFAKGEAILNRGHLIAYSLSKGIRSTGSYNPSLKSGDQNNPKNLFTQTAYSNQELQTRYENKVRSALKAGKKVIYQAQAIFNKNDLMAKGVELQAVSTDGSLNFNVFIFNVQPGFQFNYADGTSRVDRSMVIPAPANELK
ncbi:DNA/RNA non-specific endonuclease [Sporolactobacillus spathodeae]|uniref:DNA-entry nuclease n=1 Tax=Sporolactobacillus spathodeae TaxID=1465502 RepID=A0ABS2Q611_9BACL|nr:DNA/RNA non-specific endonuclease [Sporolactobacillus spathodeae]MBM7657121.1 DNA-entry nuclease [Sporolactobacillus spathodeae]